MFFHMTSSLLRSCFLMCPNPSCLENMAPAPQLRGCARTSNLCSLPGAPHLALPPTTHHPPPWVNAPLQAALGTAGTCTASPQSMQGKGRTWTVWPRALSSPDRPHSSIFSVPLCPQFPHLQMEVGFLMVLKVTRKVH